jgi:diacylglycerol kinase (ATP)
MPASTEQTPPLASSAGSPAPLSDKKVTVLGMRRVINAFFYSMEGFGSAFKHEQAFRQELLLAVILVPVSLLLPVSWVGRALMIGSVLLVLITELLNSAIEWCVDLAAEQQRHPFAKRAKDMGSAAVFLSLVNCFMVWVLVLAQAAVDGWGRQ